MQSAICSMINLRREKDRRLKDCKNASYWPWPDVQDSTESLIFNNVNCYTYLRHDGLDAAQSIARIVERNKIDLNTNNILDLKTYIKARLQVEDPEYLDLGDALLDEAIAVAADYTTFEIESKDNRFPPPEWWREKVTHEELGLYGTNQVVLRMDDDADDADVDIIEYDKFPPSFELTRLRVRAQPTDDIRHFSGSLLPNGLSYRSGIALVRDNIPIEYAIFMRG